MLRSLVHQGIIIRFFLPVIAICFLNKASYYGFTIKGLVLEYRFLFRDRKHFSFLKSIAVQ